MSGINYYPSRNQQKTQRVVTTTANVSLSLKDADSLYYCTNNGATGIFISLTEANSLQFPIGSKIDFVRANGDVTFSSAPANTSIQSANSATKIRLASAACTLIKTTSNTWVLVGDITT